MILSLDFGTSSLKTAILDSDNNIIQATRESYPYKTLPGEKVEISPENLFGALTRCCNRLPSELRCRINALTYDCFSPSLLLMDERGAPIYPVITHMDRRSRAQSEEICSRMGKDYYQSITGVYPFTGGVSLTTLVWLMQTMPNLCKRIFKIGHLPTWLHKCFTGLWVIDSVNASMTGLYETVTENDWSYEILTEFDIPRTWLPPVEQPGTIHGNLSHDMADQLGLREGIPVSVGTNDVVATHAGAGNFRSGQILNVAGSSDMISVLTDNPVLSPYYYLRGAGKKGLWQVYATTAGGFATDWFHRLFCNEMTLDAFYDDYLARCLNDYPTPTVRFKPYLTEDRQSLERKKGAFCELTLATDREEMLAALMVGMQNVLVDVLGRAEKYVDTEQLIKVTGGFANEAVLALKRRMFAGHVLEIHDNCTLKGNGILLDRQF